MKIFLFGAGGQVGTALRPLLEALGQVRLSDRQDLDLTDPSALRAAILEFSPDVIVNAAAYTAVDKAEAEPELAMAINADAPRVMATAASELGAFLVHYSTDYVFDGRKQAAYNEADTPRPLSVYGRSKFAGEQAVMDSGARYAIFRTSWVISPYGRNFAKTMLRLFREKNRLNVVNDQTGVPTTAALIADITIKAIVKDKQRQWESGLYHLAPRGKTSWYGIARELYQQAQELDLPLSLTLDDVKPIPTIDYPTPAKRPLNSCLDVEKLERALGHALPQWEEGLIKTVQDIAKGTKTNDQAA